jgi:alpha-galactosidase
MKSEEQRNPPNDHPILPAPPVLAVVGAGSLIWGRQIVVDMLRNPDLAGAEIRLIDVLPDRLALVRDWCRIAARRLGVSHTISSHTDLREGLQGATACLVAISVGGDRLWRYDAMHPQMDGIAQPVGDSTGPGGALRALRHAPALREIARALSEVGAPNAFLLQLTNPLNPLTASIDSAPGIRVYGFCHGYYDTEFLFARSLGLIAPQTDPVSRWRERAPAVRVELAGNNHFVFVNRLRIGDRLYEQEALRELTPRIFDGPFREAVWSRYGGLVGNYARHPIEYLPGFTDRASDFGRMWGIPPVNASYDPFGPLRHDEQRALIERDLETDRDDPSAPLALSLEHTHEPVAEILAAMHTGARLDVHLNLRNEGALAGLPEDLHLEMFCRIENGIVHRPSVSFPEAITAEIGRVGRSQLLVSRCCESFDEEILVEAMKSDALMMRLDETVIRRLMREMVDFEREWIFPKSTRPSP